MARYQILYWKHIPLGVKATDINGTVRENLPSRFQDAFQQHVAALDRSATAGPFTTSGFRWTEEQERDGTAAEVAAVVAKELVDTWDKAKSLASFEAQESEVSDQFIDLSDLSNH